MMRIAVPMAAGKLCMHFGHCEQFAILEIDESAGEVTSRDDQTPPPHEPGLLPRWLAEKGVTQVIAGGMGARAQQIFQAQGIQTLVGAPADTPENLAKAFMAGTLQSGQNACDH